MKTVEDLKRLREQLQTDNRLRHAAGTQVIVGMGTCGIAAGAREVLAAILDEIAKNKTAIAEQYKQVFAGQEFEIVDNYDWFKDINYLDFLRTIGKHAPMTQMLDRDFIKSRIGEGGEGISYAEFSYALIQGYDFLHLFREKGATLQVAGADHAVQVVNDLLCAPNRKGRDDDLAPSIDRAPDHIPQFHKSFFRVTVRFVAIGTFHDQMIHLFG